MIDYGKLEKALRHLECQLDHYLKRDDALPQFLQEALAESVIQRFETCYDVLWKTLKRYLVEQLGLPEVPSSPKPIFRLAHENRLLPGPVDKWILYANARIATAHDDSGDKAQQTLEIIETFVPDAIALYQTLTGSPWPPAHLPCN